MIRNSGLCALLAVAMVVQSCAGSQRSRPSYDSETLYQGLVFGVGSAAKEFPEIWQRAETRCSAEVRNSREAAQIRGRVMARIRTDNPEFFRAFGADMQSGDHLRVRKALDGAGEVTRSAIKREITDFDAVTFEQGLSSRAGTWVTITVFIDFYAAVARIRYLWLFNDLWVPDPAAIADGRPTPQLARDMLVDLVVKRLPATGSGPYAGTASGR
jgi:SdpC family antimicrobial peptide